MMSGPPACRTGAASRSPALVPSRPARIWASPLLATLVAASTCAQAAEADLARARQLLGEGSYQQAYDVLRPLQATAGADGELTLLLGEAALRTGRAEEAKALFERALALQPDSVGAHLGLVRAGRERGHRRGHRLAGQARIDREH